MPNISASAALWNSPAGASSARDELRGAYTCGCRRLQEAAGGCRRLQSESPTMLRCSYDAAVQLVPINKPRPGRLGQVDLHRSRFGRRPQSAAAAADKSSGGPGGSKPAGGGRLYGWLSQRDSLGLTYIAMLWQGRAGRDSACNTDGKRSTTGGYL